MRRAGGAACGLGAPRLGVAWGAPVSFFGSQLLQLAAALLFASLAVEAADRDGVWYGALAAAFSILALTMLVLVAFLSWAALKFGLDGRD